MCIRDSIKGYAETVRDLTGDDKAHRDEQMNIIVDEADRLTALVSSVMEMCIRDRFHRCAPAVVLGAAQGTPGGGQLGQPHIPGGIKGKAGQLALHAQDGGSVPAIGAHKIAGALFQCSTVPRSSI